MAAGGSGTRRALMPSPSLSRATTQWSCDLKVAGFRRRQMGEEPSVEMPSRGCSARSDTPRLRAPHAASRLSGGRQVAPLRRRGRLGEMRERSGGVGRGSTDAKLPVHKSIFSPTRPSAPQQQTTMANSTKLLAVAALLATASLCAVLLSSTHGGDDGVGGVPWGGASSRGILTTLPFSPMDVLPLLPRRVSMAALRALRGASDIFPVFVGAATAVPAADAASSGVVGWKGACFYENEAWLEFNNDSGTAYGGGTVHIKTSQAHSWTCMDLYVFATPYRVTWDYYFLGREHTLEITEWESKAEYEYVKHNGVSIFLMPSGTIGTLRALWDVFPLFTNTGWGENSNLAFLKKHMGANFEERPQPWVSELNVDDIHSGDFLVLSKIRGRWGGFETLEKWVTGAYAGHTAVCLRDSEGKLWVGESGHENEQGEDIIAILPWEEWWDFEVTTDDSNPQIALLPLRPDLRAKFNETAAWNYAKQMNGKPYGYHNLIFSWIDTISDNYPPPLDAHVVASVMTVWNKLQPDYAANMWTEALNKRLGTEGLDLPEIIVESEKRGMTFDKLLTVPEKDDWVYNDGQSASCVAYVLMMYKEAGLFDPLSSSIEVTEFTIKDAYVLNFFEANTTRLPAWCNKDDTVKLPFCQIKGRYRMELPGYNTMEPYAHMNERCASLPPDYLRTKDC